MNYLIVLVLCVSLCNAALRKEVELVPYKHIYTSFNIRKKIKVLEEQLRHIQAYMQLMLQEHDVLEYFMAEHEAVYVTGKILELRTSIELPVIPETDEEPLHSKGAK